MTADGETAPPSASSIGRNDANADARPGMRISLAHALSKADYRFQSCHYVLSIREASRTPRSPSRRSGVNRVKEAEALVGDHAGWTDGYGSWIKVARR